MDGGRCDGEDRPGGTQSVWGYLFISLYFFGAMDTFYFLHQDEVVACPCIRRNDWELSLIVPVLWPTVNCSLWRRDRT